MSTFGCKVHTQFGAPMEGCHACCIVQRDSLRTQLAAAVQRAEEAERVPGILVVVSLFQDVLDHPGDPYVMDRIKRWFEDKESEGSDILAAHDARVRREEREAAWERVEAAYRKAGRISSVGIECAIKGGP